MILGDMILDGTFIYEDIPYPSNQTIVLEPRFDVDAINDAWSALMVDEGDDDDDVPGLLPWWHDESDESDDVTSDDDSVVTLIHDGPGWDSLHELFPNFDRCRGREGGGRRMSG